MAVYEYRGLDKSGRHVKGVIDAADSDSAIKKLKAKDVYPEAVKELVRGGRRSLLSFSFTKKRTVTVSITRQLSFLLSAGMPVTNALEGVIDQLEDTSVKSMMIEIKEKVKEGKSVSQAFSEYPDYFNQMYVSTLHAGEVSGKLETVFEHLARMYEQNQAFIGRIKGSLTYPSLMLLFGVLIIVFLVSFIVPTFSRLFGEFGQTLPVPTRILIGLSGLITKAWWAVIVFFGALFFGVRRMYKKGAWKSGIDEIVLKLPLAGPLLLETFRIRFSYTMSLMLGNGVPIIDALRQTGGIYKNSLFTRHIKNATERVKKGESLSRSLSGGSLFTSSLLGMIRAGEAGDRVPEVLERIGTGLESQLSERIKTLTSLVEPIVIVIVGFFIGFAVLSIMLPIFQINQFFG
ncbi:MAG: type II secretion system F family protein [Spirochaetes bacterium]|nr:type II secretion system F family protein [Spirochaetota bacterium]